MDREGDVRCEKQEEEAEACVERDAAGKEPERRRES